ncbi:MAG: hypothetical protein AAF231_05025 [Pseudomonadota bacterium]
MRPLLFIFLIALTACARPLTPEEKSFAKQIHGPTIDVTRIRVRNGALVGETTFKRQKRPRLACRERILPEREEEVVTVSPAALVLYNEVFYARDWYEPNFLPEYPQAMSLFHVMLFAHEITHVWQWQNRAVTNYTPIKSASEHTRSDDPYLFDLNTSARFLDYGYEQQASIVEEYVCCKALDPAAPRTERLAKLLRGAFPLGDLKIPETVILPWDEAETKGICRI